ncbi:hypothetical protein HJ102_18265 [Vibrio parahaemolyticus]|nr:hypothetical protein [Vibrio parahaemolyticus]
MKESKSNNIETSRRNILKILGLSSAAIMSSGITNVFAAGNNAKTDSGVMSKGKLKKFKSRLCRFFP